MRRAATGSPLLASVCFAAQHPLSKPFLDILNTAPLWAAAWERVSRERRALPNAFLPTVALALAAIGGSGMLSRQADATAAGFSATSLVLFVVPATWTLRALLTHRWFDETETNVYEVTAANLLIPFLSAVLAWLLTWIEPAAGLAPDRWTIGGTASLILVLGDFTWRNRPAITDRR